jgi:hypothetical protein
MRFFGFVTMNHNPGIVQQRLYVVEALFYHRSYIRPIKDLIVWRGGSIVSRCKADCLTPDTESKSFQGELERSILALHICEDYIYLPTLKVVEILCCDSSRHRQNQSTGCKSRRGLGHQARPRPALPLPFYCTAQIQGEG